MKRIPSFVGIPFKIYGVHLLLFLVIRVAFVAANFYAYGDTTTNKSLFLQSFIMGLRFDTSVLCYIFLVPVLLLFLRDILAKEILKKAAHIFLQVLLPVSLFAACADIPYYIQFQKHLDSQIFAWMGNGGMTWRIVFSHFSYWGYILLFLPLAFVSVKTINYFFKNENDVKLNWKFSSAFFTLLFVLLVLGLRGRTAKSPIHPGLAYISEDMLVNQSGLNANFTLLNSVFVHTEKRKFFNPEKDELSLSLAKKEYGISGEEFVRVVPPADTLKKLNVVVVLMESMSSFKTGAFHQKPLTPKLNELKQQSLWFSNFYSSGIHTYNGVFSTVTGYPAILHEHALENYIYKQFNCLPSNLKAQGYQTNFFTTHDEHFDNMNGFLKYNGVDHIYSDKDFPSSAGVGVMGIPDHLMFEFAVDKMNEAKEPFFSLLLTASDHGPWEIPTDIPFKPQGKDEQERATEYADWSIGRFMEKAKKQKWFDNTLFVFLGDHGVNHGKSYHMDIAFNQVPCIFYCPKYIHSQNYSSPASQLDVFPTIMGFLGYGYSNHSMGVDLRKEKRKYAFFSQDDRIGCLNEKYYYFYLMFWGGKEYLFEYRDVNDKDFISQKRALADSMKASLVTMLQAGNYLLTSRKY